ncbi:MAG: RNA polymerase sigma factor [Candidatus Sericytochromatia bacterium]
MQQHGGQVADRHNMADRQQNRNELAEQTDEVLMQRVIARDQQAFELLAQRWSKRLVGYFLRHVGRQEPAEELAQEVLISLWKAKSYSPSRPFRHWLYTLAHNRLNDALRRKRLPQLSLDESPRDLASGESLEGAILARDEQAQLFQALQALPENQRAVLILSKFQDLDHAQIAGVLKCSRASVKVMLFRAVRQLSRLFKEMHGE